MLPTTNGALSAHGARNTTTTMPPSSRPISVPTVVVQATVVVRPLRRRAPAKTPATLAKGIPTDSPRLTGREAGVPQIHTTSGADAMVSSEPAIPQYHAAETRSRTLSSESTGVLAAACSRPPSAISAVNPADVSAAA
jgi:hypothetical protein